MIGSVVDRSLIDIIASDRSELDTRIRNSRGLEMYHIVGVGSRGGGE